MTFRSSLILVLMVLVCADGAAAAGKPSPATYHVGQRVEFVVSSMHLWYRGVVVQVRSGPSPALIHPIGYTRFSDQWTKPSAIRPPGGGTTQAIPGGTAGEASDETVVKLEKRAVRSRSHAPLASGLGAGRYSCVANLAGRVVKEGSFVIGPGASYTYGYGNGKIRSLYGGNSRGTFEMHGAIVTFHGGSLDGQRAAYDAGGGHSSLHILGPGSNRRVMDCT